MKKNNKGFTLAELLIVVAIIAVLVAIAIPVFTAQLEKSRESVDLSNIRSYYAEIVPAILTGDLDSASSKITIQGKDVTTTGAKTTAGAYQDFTVTVPLTPATDVKQSVNNWQTTTPLTIGGTTINTTQNMVGATSIVYHFKVQADGDIELDSTAGSGITFGAAG